MPRPTDRFFDPELHLELAEHAYLRSKGWLYGAGTNGVTGEGEFVWEAPPGHKGSQRYYNSRAHAINSAKRWNLNNPMQRLKVRGEL